MRIMILPLAITALASCAWAQDGSSIERAAASITAEDINARIGIIADDSMGGRNTPSAGLDKTAAYIASEFERFGLKPAGDDGSFIQSYDLVEISLDTDGSTIEFEGGPSLRFGIDASYSLGRMGDEASTGEAVLVRGHTADPDDLADFPLQGAIVIYAPGELDAAARTTVFNIYRQRPTAVLVVARYSDNFWEFATSQPPPTRLIVPGEPTRGRSVILVREESVSDYLSEAGVALGAGAPDASVSHKVLAGVDVTVHLTRSVLQNRLAPNVVGILEGSDPVLKDEYVVFSAHMDHIGTAGEPLSSCEASGSDTICNGADDDASGTAAVVEAAEAFSMLDPRPRRSLIFLAVSGEEKGLLGSRYFASNPPVPVQEIVANLNSDMIGRNWADTIVVIGVEHSDLGESLQRITGFHPELNMTPIDDRWPGQRFYYRSDHYNFARRGVPILFFFNGTHDDYHQASDEVTKIDADKASRIAKLEFYLGLHIANANARPLWNPESYASIVDRAPTAAPE